MGRANPHSLGGWETNRHAYPLEPRAMGLVDGEAWVARANWDRVEVRDENGALRFEHTIPPAMGDGLLHGFAFVGAHLACALGNGLTAYGLRVWDLHTGEAVMDLATGDVNGRYLLSSPPGSSLVLVGDPECVAVWDVPLRRRLRTFALGDVLEGAFEPASGRLACGDFALLRVHDPSGAPLVSWSVEGDVETLAWGGEGSLLVSTTTRGAAQVWRAEDGSLVAGLEAVGDILASSPCGRWIAFEDGVTDLDALTVRRAVARAAVFDPASASFVVADADRIWRIPV
ncbi:MAG: hypothetical protein U0234_12705 [Sandaracinus sp.]